MDNILAAMLRSAGAAVAALAAAALVELLASPSALAAEAALLEGTHSPVTLAAEGSGSGTSPECYSCGAGLTLAVSQL